MTDEEYQSKANGKKKKKIPGYKILKLYGAEIRTLRAKSERWINAAEM